MMANFSLPIAPFDVPTHVTLQLPPGRREDGMRNPVTIPLADLTDETLNALIEEFVTGIMATAGRPT